MFNFNINGQVSNSIRFLSLPGHLRSVFLQTQGQVQQPNCSDAFVIWIPDYYPESQKLIEEQCEGGQTRCLTKLKSELSQKMYSLVDFSSLLSVHCENQFKTMTIPLFSWNQAQAVCVNNEAKLPSFHDKQEQDEIIAYLKKKTALAPPVRALFIGMAQGTITKVKNFKTVLFIGHKGTKCIVVTCKIKIVRNTWVEILLSFLKDVL